jgi:hypothetical protein
MKQRKILPGVFFGPTFAVFFASSIPLKTPSLEKMRQPGSLPRAVLLVLATPHPSKNFSISFFATALRLWQVVPMHKQQANHQHTQPSGTLQHQMIGRLIARSIGNKVEVEPRTVLKRQGSLISIDTSANDDER